MAVSCQDRIFRNDPALRYRYRIHEELHHGRKKELHHYDAQESLRIFHTGYGRQTDQQEKAARNARLLERDLQDNPTDASRLMYLGDAYGSMQGRQQEALDCYRKVLWDRQMQVEDPVVLLRSGIQILSMLQNEPTEETEDEYFRISGELRKQGYDMHPDVDYFMGLWHLKAGELKKAALLFESAMGKLADYRGVDVVRMISNMEMVNWAISAAALESGNPQKAVPFAVSALRINKYSPEGIQLLLSAFQTEFSPGMDAEPYWQFLCRIYDTGNLKDMLFVRKFAEDVGFQEIRQRAEQMLPPEARD